MFSTTGLGRSAPAGVRARANAPHLLSAWRFLVALVAAAAAALAFTGTASAATIAAGESHTCTVRGAEGIYCWGVNSHGQLGTANTKTYLYRIRTKLSGNTKAIAAGDRHTCSVRRDGTVACWGANESGQLGTGVPAGSSKLAVVPGISDATDITAGNAHTCVLRATGAVSCWGANNFDQVGNRVSVPVVQSPAEVVGLTDVVSIGAGGDHTCAVRSSGTVRCWGANVEGELGNGTNSISRPLVQVVDMRTAVKVVAGDNHTCVLHRTGADYVNYPSNITSQAGQVSCWGRNAELQSQSYPASHPSKVANVNGATSITAGGHHSCALRGDGTVRCWGRNIEGELGNGKTETASNPITVQRITTGTEIAAGARHTCALRANAQLLCWGGNGGQLGFGPSLDKDFTKPMKVHALPDPTPFSGV